MKPEELLEKLAAYFTVKGYASKEPETAIWEEAYKAVQDLIHNPEADLFENADIYECGCPKDGFGCLGFHGT